LPRKSNKCRNQKIVFYSIFFCWEASTYQISVKFIKLFGFCQFFLFLVNFGGFLPKKWNKSRNQKTIYYSIFLLESIYIPNFRKIHQTVWILPIFFIFYQSWLFFWPKKVKMSGSGIYFFLFFRSIYTPNFRKIHLPVWILPINFIFGNFWLLFGQKRPIYAEIKNSFYNIFFCWEASTYQISKNSSNGLDFSNFIHFWLILAVFLPRNSNKCRNQKTI